MAKGWKAWTPPSTLRSPLRDVRRQRQQQHDHPCPPPPYSIVLGCFSRYKRSSVVQLVQPGGRGDEDRPSWGPIHLAVHRAAAMEVRELLLAGVGKESKIERGFTPLLLAAQDGHEECIAEVCTKPMVACTIPWLGVFSSQQVCSIDSAFCGALQG